MADPHRTILEADLSAAEIVAKVSGRKPRDERWTELAIYDVTLAWGEINQTFVAEIVGETQHKGEERRVRRARFTSVIEALAWGAFNAKSALYSELRQKATNWLEAKMRGTGMVIVQGMDEATLEQLRDAPAGNVAALPADDPVKAGEPWYAADTAPLTKTVLTAQWFGSPYGWVLGSGYRRGVDGKWVVRALDPFHDDMKLTKPSYWRILPDAPVVKGWGS